MFLQRSFQIVSKGLISINRCRLRTVLAARPFSRLLAAEAGKRNFSFSQFSNAEVKGIWDDSGWMNHGDSNAEAYETLDITKLRPFPEFRNVVSGPVWPTGAFNLVWDKYYNEQLPEHYVRQQEKEWEDFVEEKGFTPEEYFSSEEYNELYEKRLIWADYRRNHKGSRQSQKPRPACKITEEMKKGNPCPLCRDRNLLLNYRNLLLLQHFIDPLSGKVFHPLRTGVCRRKQNLLEHTVWLARDQGFMARPVPNSEFINPDNYRVDYLAVRPFSKPSSL